MKTFKPPNKNDDGDKGGEDADDEESVVVGGKTGAIETEADVGTDTVIDEVTLEKNGTDTVIDEVTLEENGA